MNGTDFSHKSPGIQRVSEGTSLMTSASVEEQERERVVRLGVEHEEKHCKWRWASSIAGL